MVYDAPLLKKPFIDRLEVIKTKLGAINSKHVQYLPHKLCQGKEDLLEQSDKIIDEKGEGMMVKCPKSMYERKRSALLLKVKKFYHTEATIIGFEKGTGRCSFMTGALIM